MTRLEAPRSLNATVQSAYNFYGKRGALHYYHHTHDVLRIGAKNRIIEGSVISNKRETIERRWANAVLAAVSLYHVVEPSKLALVMDNLPAELRNERVLHELETFCKITDVVRSGGTLSDLASLLNNGHAPLALLVLLSDYAVTHNAEDRLAGLIDPAHQSIFRCYDSEDAAFLSMRMDASAAENIFAPVAELFGYPKLAGTIIKHAYRVNHRPLYDFVTTLLSDEVIKQRLAFTQRTVRELSSHVRSMLSEYGFDVDVQYRPVKSEGKLMRKIYRIMQEQHAESIETPCAVVSHLMDSHIISALPHFDSFQEIHDWSAVRVVLIKHKGREIDKLSLEEQMEVYEFARRIVDFAVTLSLNQINADYQYKLIEKSNGYKGGHRDVFPRPNMIEGFADANGTALNFEVQLKLHEWHEVAEHGKAAHYYYIGGDPTFMRMLDASYHDIIHGTIGKNGSLKGKPPHRP